MVFVLFQVGHVCAVFDSGSSFNRSITGWAWWCQQSLRHWWWWQVGTECQLKVPRLLSMCLSLDDLGLILGDFQKPTLHISLAWFGGNFQKLSLHVSLAWFYGIFRNLPFMFPWLDFMEFSETFLSHFLCLIFRNFQKPSYNVFFVWFRELSETLLSCFLCLSYGIFRNLPITFSVWFVEF